MICQECGEMLTGLRRKFCSARFSQKDWQRVNRESLNRAARERYHNDPIRRENHQRLMRLREERLREEGGD